MSQISTQVEKNISDTHEDTSNRAKSHLPFHVLVISLLRIYILSTTTSSTKHRVTNYDLLLPLCATIHVLSEILPRDNTCDIHLSGSDTAIIEKTGRQPLRSVNKRFLAKLSTFLNNRKPAVEVIAIAAMLRLARDPKDACSIWFAWNTALAGCFGGTAHSYMMQRAKEGKTESGPLDRWIGTFLGLWVAFIA